MHVPRRSDTLTRVCTHTCIVHMDTHNVHAYPPTQVHLCNTPPPLTPLQLEFEWEALVSQRGTAAVVDGRRLLLTPLRHTLVPPPMCAAPVRCSGPVACAALCDFGDAEVGPAWSNILEGMEYMEYVHRVMPKWVLPGEIQGCMAFVEYILYAYTAYACADYACMMPRALPGTSQGQHVHSGAACLLPCSLLAAQQR